MKRKVKSLTRKIKMKMYRIFKSSQLTNNDITIISNNCWGGTFYNLHKTRVNSPTINMYIMAKDYIVFCQSLKELIERELIFIKFEESKHKDYLFSQNYKKRFPIAKLGDIEIMFVHYENEESVINAWNRRKQRIDFNNIIYKFNDQNNCSNNDLKMFDQMELDNKIIFTVRDDIKLNNAIYINYKNK